MPWIDAYREDLQKWIDLTWERANSLRPPTAVDFSWWSTWPVPLYGLACAAHWRFRAFKPRRLPTLTTVTLPEIYGIFALGHVSHLEANRLSRKVAEDPGLKVIQRVATWARKEYRRYPERFTVPVGLEDLEGVDYTGLLLKGVPEDDFHFRRFALRLSWADTEYRTAASYLLTRRVRLAAPRTIPYRDVALVTLFVSEELDGGSSIIRPAFLRDMPLMAKYAGFVFVSTLTRWISSSSSSGALRTNALLERYFVYFFAFKWLGGRYCHYASLLGLEEPSKGVVAFLTGLSFMDWHIKHGTYVAEGDPGAMFAELGLEVPPWFGEV
ncbi:hypothetical protein GSI_07873 [Ganoderma sinense ZZ0214-1]|uniref:Uncharacterized protein n=1 Tax=Ganoderma sinense ZZ0214-1 TaxID=1077348 RepID=A0A2G8S848_9APHY|nr:hypothetical protein GSI_07873 [Ganoderma sinense ZZ0214-1]